MPAHITIRNWSRLQHYRDRSPPWIKLHRSLLNDREWGLLSGDAAKLLVELWLLAAEADTAGSIEADLREIAWRTRRSEPDIPPLLDELIGADFIAMQDEPPADQEICVAAATQSPAELGRWPSRYVAAATRAAVIDRDGGRCVACATQENLEVNHIVPVSQGGTSEIGNLQLLCRSCNRRKRVRSTRYAVQHLRSPETETETETEKRHLTGASAFAAAPSSMVVEIPKPKRAARSAAYPDDFETFWAAYPKRAGGNPKRRAYHAWNARKRDGGLDGVMEGLERYRRFCLATGKIGTELVLQAATFLGPDRRWTEPWAVPPPREPRVSSGGPVPFVYRPPPRPPTAAPVKLGDVLPQAEAAARARAIRDMLRQNGKGTADHG